jgi:hypothetical protein
MNIHQGQGVCRILKIRVHIVRRSAGEALDVRKIHDGFVELHDHRREQRNSPTVVVASVAARRGGRQARAHRAVERHVVLLERVHGEVVIRADGAEILLWTKPSVLGRIKDFPSDVRIGILGIIADVGASAVEALTAGINPRGPRRMARLARDVGAVVNAVKIDRLAVVVGPRRSAEGQEEPFRTLS